MKKLLFLLMLPVLFCQELSSQSAVLTAGGDASGTGGSVAYSIGQAAYTHIDGESGRISLGVQQPHFVIMVSTENPVLEVSATIYPNPVSDQVTLMLHDKHTEWLESSQLSMRLHDLNGKVIMNKKISDSITSLSLSHLAESVYVLTIFEEGREIKSFKIFKSK